jgi:DNA-binding MarR family transcriptional regulator
MCGSFRRTSRALTQSYEQALRPLGLRTTQFTILQVLARAGELSQGQLGEMLAMDSTTLTRTLEVMHRQGWIAQRRGEDRRQRFVRLAEGGKHQLDRAQPVWEQLQARLRHRLGQRTWDNLLQLTNEVANVIESQEDRL